MDLVMPVMDGFEATRQIRQMPALAQTKIIAVTASTVIVPEKIRTEYGCDDFLLKPINITDVLEKLADHLGLQWQYQDQTPTTARLSSQPFQDVRFTPDQNFRTPPEVEIARLYNAVLDGDVQQLRRHLDALQQQEPAYRPFVDHLRNLLKTFDEDALCQFLQPYRGGSL